MSSITATDSFHCKSRHVYCVRHFRVTRGYELMPVTAYGGLLPGLWYVFVGRQLAKGTHEVLLPAIM